MPAEITLRFNLTEKDYVDAVRLYYAAVRRLRLKTDAAIGAAAIVLGIVLTFLAYTYWLWYVLMGVGALLLLLVLAAMVIIPRVRFRSEPKFRDEYLLKFDESGIEFKTASIDSKLEWTLYSRLVENADTFLLIYGKAGFSVIPKRVFASRAEQDEFRALVNTKIA